MYEWNHMVLVFLWLPYFTEHNALQFHLCCHSLSLFKDLSSWPCTHSSSEFLDLASCQISAPSVLLFSYSEEFQLALPNISKLTHPQLFLIVFKHAKGQNAGDKMSFLLSKLKTLELYSAFILKDKSVLDSDGVIMDNYQYVKHWFVEDDGSMCMFKSSW